MTKMRAYAPALILISVFLSACGLGGKVVPDSAAGLPTRLTPAPTPTPVAPEPAVAPVAAPVAAPATMLPAAPAAEGAITTGPLIATPPDLLDQTTAQQRASALTAGTGEGDELGQVVVSLGSPTDQGIWLKSSLVTVPQKGRVVTDQGAALILDLIPATGAAQLSLAAYRALGLPLTGLPTVTVYGE